VSVCCRKTPMGPVQRHRVDRTLARPSTPAEDPARGLRRSVDPELVLRALRTGDPVDALAEAHLLDELDQALLDQTPAMVDERPVTNVEFAGQYPDVEGQTVMVVGAAPEVAVNTIGGDPFPSDATVESLGVRSTSRFGSVPFDKGDGLSATFAFLDGRKLMVRRSPVSIGAPVRGCFRCAEGLSF
jgi:hypothetical protein